jgi:glycine dehydrogenase subunit 1
MKELGETIVQKANYAMNLLRKIKGVRTPVFSSPHFKEFTVNFDEKQLTVKKVNQKLLRSKMQGGKDISKEFPELGETALYCVTEIHTRKEIDRLAEALAKIAG